MTPRIASLQDSSRNTAKHSDYMGPLPQSSSCFGESQGQLFTIMQAYRENRPFDPGVIILSDHYVKGVNSICS